ncbi:phage tail protein [Histophilus somni]|uniref:phage tail protein n=1 Tax=Histophilus somni TaxID=731 RepID=UPI00201F154E|nr:phage tail protein [Histophilus somni]
MKKLDQLRKQLLKLPYLKLKPEEVHVFAEQGTVLSYYARPEDPNTNDHFQLEYTAQIIILNYSGAPEVLIHSVNQWLRQHQPSHKIDAIQFEAEILNNDSVDIRISIQGIKDTYKPQQRNKGTLIVECVNKPADPIISAKLKEINYE